MTNWVNSDKTDVVAWINYLPGSRIRLARRRSTSRNRLIRMDLYPQRRIGLFEYHGYLGSGYGLNSVGGQQVAFEAPGTEVKYRLGNEAETYGEFILSTTGSIQMKVATRHG